MRWVIENTDKVGDLSKLTNAIERAGHELVRMNIDDVEGPSCYDTLMCDHILCDQKKPTLCYGTILFIKKIKNKKYCGSPLFYATDKVYDCTRYIPVLGKEYLNWDYQLRPLRDIPNDGGTVLLDDLFIRPVGGYKDFSGYIIKADDAWKRNRTYATEINDLIQATSWVEDPIVLLAPAQEIKEEYRFVVVGEEVIAGSQYIPEEKGIMPTIQELKIRNYAQKIVDLINKPSLTQWIPDAVYTLDIAILNNNLMKVIEFNSFSCAGLYDCDMGVIVEAINHHILSERGEA